MTIIRRRQTISNKYGQLVLGVILGAIFMFVCLGPYTTSSSSDNIMLSISPRSIVDQKDDGWNTIHVFYGNRNSIPGLEKIGQGSPSQEQWFAQVRQDQLVMDLLGPNGYFIDLAANDAVEWTNTLALERHGWKGLCIEPNPRYWYGLSHRKCITVGALVGGSSSELQQVKVQFRGVYGGIVGKLDNQLANRKREPQAPEENRYLAPLQDVFERFHVPPVIDYLSLDVEGAELLIMKEFPFDKYQIKVLTIERPEQDLKDLLGRHGYIYLKDLVWWGETLWAHKSTGFTPDHPKIQKIITEQAN